MERKLLIETMELLGTLGSLKVLDVNRVKKLRDKIKSYLIKNNSGYNGDSEFYTGKTSK